ncbi:hypothetical protein [Streptomyces sp. NPDC000880]
MSSSSSGLRGQGPALQGLAQVGCEHLAEETTLTELLTGVTVHGMDGGK